MSTHLITGGAGFIGVNLARRLLDSHQTVVAIDDFSMGRRDFLEPLRAYPNFYFIEADCSNYNDLERSVRDIQARTSIDEVWHLAANSDIPAGVSNARIDLKRTFMTTFETLEAMKAFNIGKIHFASSSAIYGDAGDDLIREDRGSPEPVSNYGAMKLASEAQIRAACESFVHCANILRFPNVIGTPATHGVIVDLIRKGRATPEGFDVLGDGTQCKIYLHVEDLIDAMTFIAARLSAGFNVFNIGPSDGGVTVREIAESVRDHVAQGAIIRYGKTNKGWVGDVPRFRYSTEKLAALGWRSAHDSATAVRRAIKEIAEQDITS